MTTLNTQVSTLSSSINSEALPMNNIYDHFLDNEINLDAQEQAWIDSIVTQAEQAKTEQVATELKRAASLAISVVRAIRLYRVAITVRNAKLAHQVLRSILEVTKYWKFRFNVQKAAYPLTPVSDTAEYREGRKTRQAYYRDTLVYLSNTEGSDISEIVETFDWGVENIFNRYRSLTNQEVENYRTEVARNRNLALEFVPPVENETVHFRITTSALLLEVKRNAKFKIGGFEFTVKRDRRFSLTIKDIVNNIFEASRRVNIHTRIENTDEVGRTFVTYGEDILEVGGSILNKIFLLKMNRIAIDKLYTAEKAQKVVAYDHKTNKISNVPYPTTELFNVYQNTGLVSTSEAEAGYTDEIKDVKGLIQFVNNGETTIAISVNAINKTISRNDKQEKVTWPIGTHRVFIAADVTSPEVFADLGAGGFIVNEAFLRKYGLCRITSKMAQGGFKAVTNYADCNKNGPLILSPSAFKGGIVAALSLTGLDVRLSQLAALPTDKIVEAFEDQLTTIEFNGYELKGFYVEVELNISNAYLVEQYKIAGEQLQEDEVEHVLTSIRSTVEQVLDHTNKMPSALRNMIMHRVVNEADFEVVPCLQALLEQGCIVAKELATRHTASVFQSIAQWHGTETAQNLINSLIKRLPTHERVKKQLSAQYLLNTFEVKQTVNVKDLINALIEECTSNNMPILEDVDTYPISLRDRIFALVGYDEASQLKAEYTSVLFGTNIVYIPVTVGSFYTAERETDRSFLATGFMKELLIAVKACTESLDNGNTIISMNSFEGAGSKLDAVVQKRLTGKNFGYLTTYGTYQVMLNLVGSTEIARDELRVTNLDMFREKNESNKQALEVNGTKHPAYFKDASAGYMLTQHSFESEVANFALQKAVFMNTFTIMIMENDIDGDAKQISRDGFQLPFFRGPMNEFNGVEFKNFIDSEQADARLTGKRVKLLHSTMEEVHSALYSAASAKSNIGLFTSVKYKYESVLEGIVSFKGTNGVEYTLSTEDKYMITNTLSRMCQTEAMDNVKQQGASSENMFLMSMVAPYQFTSITPKSGETVEGILEERIERVRVRLASIFANWNVPAGFDVVMAQALAYSASLMKVQGTVALNIFSDRTAEKRLTEVIENLSQGTENNEWNLKGILEEGNDALSSSSDAMSLYSYLAYSLVTIK